jgi:hypothetical protein
MNYDKEFENHIVATKFVSPDNKCGYFIVRNQEDSNLWFQITFAPGVFMLSGDIGEMVFNKPLGWLSESVINSTDYLLEKLSQDMKNPKRFSVSEAADYLEDELEALKHELNEPEAKEKIEAIEDAKFVLWDAEDNPPEVTYHNFIEATLPLWEGNDVPVLEKLTDKTKLRIAALRKFCQLVPDIYK